jgi:hypothetical protein
MHWTFAIFIIASYLLQLGYATAVTANLDSAGLQTDDPYSILEHAAHDAGAPVLGLSGHYRGKHVVIVGAGAAGVAASRWLADRQVRVTLLEARDRIGGRVHTDRSTFGFAVEQGATAIHGPNENPLTALANTFGIVCFLF